MAEGFPEIAPQHRALRFQRRRHFQVRQARLALALVNPAETASQPRIAQRAIDENRLIEESQGVTDTVLSGQQKTFQRERLRVAGRKLQTLLQCCHRLWLSA